MNADEVYFAALQQRVVGYGLETLRLNAVVARQVGRVTPCAPGKGLPALPHQIELRRQCGLQWLVLTWKSSRLMMSDSRAGLAGHRACAVKR